MHTDGVNNSVMACPSLLTLNVSLNKEMDGLYSQTSSPHNTNTPARVFTDQCHQHSLVWGWGWSGAGGSTSWNRSVEQVMITRISKESNEKRNYSCCPCDDFFSLIFTHQKHPLAFSKMEEDALQ